MEVTPACTSGPHRRRYCYIRHVASENPEITQSNHDHILSDLHDALRILHKLEKAWDKFAPLVDRFNSPLASRLPGGRRNGRD